MKILLNINSKRNFYPQYSMLFFVMVLLAVLLFVRDVGNVAMSRWIFISIASLVLVFCSKSNIYCLFAFITPLNTGISFTYISSIALVILLLKQKLSLRVHYVGFMCLCFILAIEFCSGFRGLFSVVDYMRFVGVFCISIFFMIDKDKDYDVEKILHFFLMGVTFGLFIVWAQMLNEYSLSELISLGIRFGNVEKSLSIVEEGMRLSYNQNALGSLCMLSIFIALILNQRKHCKLYLFLVAFATISGVMTQSRSFLLCYIIGIALFFLLCSSDIKKAFKNIFALAGIGGLLICVVGYLLPEYVNSFISRFDTHDVSGGRIDIFLHYAQCLWQHFDRLLIGAGLQNYPEKYGMYISAHNGTQEIILTWGLVGLIVVIIMLVCSLKNASKKKPEVPYLYYIPFFLFLLITQSGQCFSLTSPVALMMISYAVLLLPCQVKDDVLKNKKR